MNTLQALKIFGFSETAIPQKDEIRKRYRILSLKHHPDKGGDSEKFKMINFAYRILTGEEKTDETILPPPSKTDEMFSEVFKGFENLFSKFNGQRVRQTRKKRICISVNELFVGAVRTLEFIQGTTCSNCSGTGTGSNERCPECSGAGYFMVDRKGTNIPSFYKIACKKCKGKRAIGRGSTKMCGKCSGEGVEYGKVRKTIRIPKGVKHNTRIIVGENTETPTEIIIQHPNQTDDKWLNWSLNDDTRDLEIKYTISLKDAMLGAIHKIKHPNGNEIELNVPRGIQPNETIIFKDKGLPPCPELKMPPTKAVIKIMIDIPKLKETEKAFAEDFFNKITQHASS